MGDSDIDRARRDDLLAACVAAREVLRSWDGRGLRRSPIPAIKALDRVIAVEEAIRDAEVRFAGVTFDDGDAEGEHQ